MKVLYLTAESYLRQPIIKSQVEHLLEVLSTRNDISLIVYTTFESLKQSNLRKVTDKLLNYQFKDKGPILNFFIMCYYLMKNMGKFDVIHCRSDRPMLPILLLNFYYKKKVIYDPRGLYGDELLYHNRYLLGYIFKSLEFIFYKMSTITVVVSSHFKAYIEDKYKVKNILVIPTFSKKNDINITRDKSKNFRMKLGWEHNTLFVYSGAFEKWQLIDKVMKLFCYIHQAIPDARFVVFSKDRTLFENAFKQNLIPTKYFYIDTIKSEELTEALSMCNYGIILRDNNIINKVASPIKIKDYLLAGLQLICTNSIGDDSDFIRENNLGVVIENLDDESLIRCVSLIKEQMEKASEISSARELLMQKFSVNEIANDYYSLYKSL